MRSLLAYSGIAIISSGLGWYLLSGPEHTPSTLSRDNGAESQEHADFFITKADITEFNLQGLKEQHLLSKQISHFPTSELTVLENPVLTSLEDPKEPQTTRAKTGRILPDGETIELEDQVVLIQKRADRSKLQLETDFLTIYSGQDYADTNRPVVITDRGDVTRATGMTTYYKQGRMVLKSKVRGVYESQ